MAGRKTGGSTAQTGETTAGRQAKDRGKEQRPESTVQPRGARAAKPVPVEVTFSVTVPESTAKLKRSVYLAGGFNQFNNKMNDWAAGGQKMKKVDATTWTAKLKIPQNTTVEYKYTLGDWETVERDLQCGDTVNRRLTTGSSETQTINDVVQNWGSSGPCES